MPSWGIIRSVEPAGFTNISALGVEEQRVNVIVDPPASGRITGDGFRVEGSIVTRSSPRALVIPRSALVRENDATETSQWVTYVLNAGRLERRTVRTGHIGNLGAEVVSGVREREDVVLFPSDQITNGARARRSGA